MDDLTTIPDEELDQKRRDILTEQERRQKVADGHARVGATIRDYLNAAGEECPDKTDEELGAVAITAVTTHTR